ncbi:M20 family metallopeptidase [Streptomyces sp. NPDC090052]|uniref:M20 metallopeptidase family protein n=1 Tax=unclassified Streptomyces TaxID=2593676 RepID=UPI00225BF216|nr:M20 family metallopeptidase [Streptomyces sp. NBC_01306]MCX4725852.1 M20 family metallopeptidase [Streptomyces sp. NBC_01306]WSV04801.1 M20 family metallopeptidase [Streptomyces sp. NBC_01020]WSX42866.1 M20 family metallopeptidase [Streptomyces sp. NBC_00963]WSX69118.1 M20 family metallopeptidase [Streptomyces sp. NBC_00932]
MNLRDDARALSDDLVRLRRSLHRIPEVGLELPRTQEAVLAELDGLPLEVRTGDGLSSVTAVLHGAQPGPTVLLRGDMDALPVAERTGLDFAADTGRMHACGHDLHTTMLTGAAKLLSAHRDRLAGDVLFMFQPGEEGFDGARHMLAEGLLETSGRRPDAAYAIHVMSAGLPSGVFGTRGGPALAASNVLRVTVRGEGGHGSMPHRAKDPVQAACSMVSALQVWITRTFDVFDPVILTVGSFHAGTKQNVIPDTAVFEATVRSFSPQAQARIKDGSVEVCRGIAAAFGVGVDADFAELYPVTVNDHAEADFVADVVRDALGEERYAALRQPLHGSEDFSRVLAEVPGAMLTLGAPPAGADPERSANNHSPLAEFDDAVLADGAAVYAELAARRLAQEPVAG